MPEYTYTFIDIRSQQKLGALPLYGVNCTDLLVQNATGTVAGTFTGSTRMDGDFATTQEILDMTRPESTMIWMERDETPIWCGILWTRTYQSDGRVLQLNAQTFSSYHTKVVWRPADTNVHTYSLTDNPHNVIRYLWQYCISEASPEYDVGVRLEAYHQDVYDEVVTQVFNRTDYKPLREYGEDPMKAGAEYRIVPSIVDGVRVPIFQSGPPNTLGVTQNAADQSTPYQYPGDLSKYWLTNSSANAPTRLIAIGKSEGQDEIVSVHQGSTTNRIGVDEVVSYETGDLTVLSRLGANDLTSKQSDLNRPIYEVAAGHAEPSFGLGDYRRVVIDDPYRFPQPMGGALRVVGWSLSPADSGGMEQQTIVIDNVSNLVALDV